MKPPLIFIDALGIDKPGGPRTAVLNLLTALFIEKPSWRFKVFVSCKESSFEKFPHVDQVELPIGTGILAWLAFQLLLLFSIIVDRPQIIHFTKNVPSFAPGISKILTIFDVTTITLPEYHSFTAVFFWRYIYPRLARRCDAIIAISKTVANDIRNYLGRKTPPIHIVYCASQFTEQLGIQITPVESVRNRYSLPSTYFLAVGQIALKKNLSTIIKAYAKLNESNNNISPLILAGPHYPQSDDLKALDLINQLGLEKKVRYIGKVEVDDLPGLYRGASIFLMPSINEGFGIPCVEAMQFNVPIIASKATALPEIIGDAGILIDDYMNPQVWTEKIELLFNDRELHNKLIRAGAERVKAFDWKNSAKIVSQIYQNTMGQNYGE